MRYTGKRGARTHPITGKRLAMSLSVPRPAMSRQASPSTHEDRERSPRSRTPKSIEERLRNLEMQGSFNSNTVKDLKDALDNQIKMALELRREVYTSKAIVAEMVQAIEAKFHTLEVPLEDKIASIDCQLAALQQSIEQAQAQLPMDGQVVAETFATLAIEISKLKGAQGETFTRAMRDALQVMERQVADHGRRLAEGPGSNEYLSNLSERVTNLDAAYAQILATLENAYTPPVGYTACPWPPDATKCARLAATTTPTTWSSPRAFARRPRRLWRLFWELL